MQLPLYSKATLGEEKGYYLALFSVIFLVNIIYCQVVFEQNINYLVCMTLLLFIIILTGIFFEKNGI